MDTKLLNDPLYLAAISFSKFINKNFIYTLDNGAMIEVMFKRCNFAHLIGLHKLIDIELLRKLSDKRYHISDLVYKQILKGKLTYEQISTSAFFDDMEDRLINFKSIDELLFSEIIINFDKSKVRKSDLKSTVILFEKKGTNYLHLCIAKDSKTNSHYPETFLVQADKYYINGQDKVLVRSVRIIDSKSKNTERLFLSVNGKFVEQAVVLT